MTYTKFIQVGRVAYVALGPEQGKLVAILDIIDQNRVLVDGPGVRRQSVNVKTLYLTKYLLKVQHSARVASVKRAWAKAEVDKKWAESSWAKRIAAKKVRTNLTDFERFRLMKAKQAKNRMITLEVGKLKLKARKAVTEAKKSGKKPAAAKSTGKK